jgi:hypothetical protein
MVTERVQMLRFYPTAKHEFELEQTDPLRLKSDSMVILNNSRVILDNSMMILDNSRVILDNSGYLSITPGVILSDSRVTTQGLVYTAPKLWSKV